MVKKTSTKYFFKIFRNNLSAFFSLLLITAISVGFSSGIGTAPQLAKSSLSDYYNRHNTPDAIYYLNDNLNIQSLKAHSNIEYCVGFAQIEFKDKDINTRLIFFDKTEISFIKVQSGEFLKQNFEAAAEQDSTVIQNPKIDSVVTVLGKDVKITSTVENPLYLSKSKEPYLDTNEDIQRLLYLDINDFELPPNAIFLKFKNLQNLNRFDKKYENLLENNLQSLENQGLLNGGTPLPFGQNVSFVLLKETTDKIAILSFIFPIFFLLVSALSAVVGASRLIERERPNIAALKILGFNRPFIVMRYVFFSAACSLIGSVFGMIIGPAAFSTMIYNIFTLNFFMPPKIAGFYALYGISTSLIVTITVSLIAFFIALKPASEMPAQLTVPKSPKAGKKIFLEKMPFIWKRLKFKYKSSFRNVFRYTKNFILTILSITGAGALVFAGFALQNSSDALTITAESGLGGMYLSISLVALIIILCAAFLSVLVIYNLADINIGQRKREIATLKVLGYTESEVLGYIFRELLIMSVVGAILGLPCGFFLIKFIFSYVGFGSVDHIKWFVWPLSFFLIIAFAILASLLLFKKIKKIEMGTSLKTD